MTNLLLHLFTKRTTGKTRSQREAFGRLSGAVGIVLNFCLFVLKLAIGLISGSISVTADAINNLTDSIASGITLVGFKLAGKPADKEHPFGHGRVEDIAGLIIALSMILLGVEFVRSSIENIITPPEMDVSLIKLGLLIIPFFVKLWMYFFNRKLGRIIGSETLLTVAKDSINDCIISVATITSLTVTAVSGVFIDGYIGILVALVLIRSGVMSAKGVLGPILGTPVDRATASAITEIVTKQEGIIGVHDLVVHNYGSKRFVATIHAEVPMDVPISVSHQSVHAAEEAVLDKLGIILTIHMDPVDTGDKRMMDLKEMVCNLISEQFPKANAHDFRTIETNKDNTGSFTFIFELEIPHDTSKLEKETMLSLIKEEINAIYPKCSVKINVEHGFVSET